MKKLALVWSPFLLLALPLTSQAQAPELEWQRCLGGSSGEFGYGIQATADGGAVVAGFTLSTDGDVIGNHGSRDFWLTKVDASGALQWQHCYGGTESETANGVAAAADGGFLVFGGTSSSDGDVACDSASASTSSVWLFRTNATGAMEWQVCLGGNSSEDAMDALATSDGGWVITGSTFSTDGIGDGNHGLADCFVVKLDATGGVQWTRCYGGSGSERAWSIRQTSDGGYIFVGTAESSDGDMDTATVGRIWVVKIDPTGAIEWNRRMGGATSTSGDEVRDILQTSDGGYWVACSTHSDDGDVSGNHGGTDVWIVRLDASGDIVQQKCFGGSDDDRAYEMMRINNGGYVLAGYTASHDGDVSGNSDTTYTNFWVFMIDDEMNFAWQTCMGGSGPDIIQGIGLTADASIMIAGRTGSNDGDVSGNHGSADVWVAKLAKDTTLGMAELHGQQQQLSVYPSPATDLLNVQLPEGMAAGSSLDVVDITGRIVLHRQVDGTTPVLRLHAGHLAQGTYCARLVSGTQVYTARFMKQ